MNKQQETVYFFYEYVYDEYLIFSESLSRKENIKIFKKLPFIPWEVSKIISWIIYSLIYIIFIPFNFLDKIFFFKSEYFKNNSNGTSLLLRAIWSTVIMLAIYNFLDDKSAHLELRDYALGAGLLFGLYWNARNVFTRKWDYAASLFNKLCFEIPFKNYRDKNHKRISLHFLQSTLAIDLLLLEIWSHKSYYYCFREILECALVYNIYCDSYKQTGQYINRDLILRDAKEKLENIYLGKTIKYSDVKEILEKFQGDISNYVVHADF